MMKQLVLILSLSCMACMHQDTRQISIEGRLVEIDSCLAPLVDALNKGGVKTISSCCGHGKGWGFVQLEDRLIIITPQTNKIEALRLYQELCEERAGKWGRLAERIKLEKKSWRD